MGIDMSALIAQNRENFHFFWGGGEFTPKGTLPLNDFFTKFCMGEGVTGTHPSAKFNPVGFKNVGLQSPNSPKSVFFGNNLPERGMSL